MKSAKEQVIQHIKGHNKRLPKEYLEKLNFSQLLCQVHPNDREYFTKMLGENQKSNSKE